jgi:UDP-2,3-diacylglucosamine hydrolase
MNYTLFISDLHLQESQLKKTDLFLKFLSTATKVDALYILGDLFEAWVGDDDNSSFCKKIKIALKQYTTSGIPTYLMRGNRDFLIGKKFIQDTGCIFINDPLKIDLYGVPTILTHGDLLCTKDKSYMRYRKLVHNPICQKLFLLLPLKLRKLIANYLRAKSKKNHQLKLGKKNISKESVIHLMQQHNVTQLIHGHIHKPAICKIKSNEVTGKCISLDAWEDTDSSLIYYQDHTFKFKSNDNL